jgi:protein-disulfide isomerase
VVRRLLLALFAVSVACADPPPRVPTAPPARAASVASEEPTPTSELVPVHADEPSLGPKNAPVTIVVFSDFQCPFCKRVEPTVAALRASYGEQLRVVWKDFPLSFHKYAREAAIVARVVYLSRGNEAFWRMHRRIFDEQTQLSSESLVAWAAELGVDENTIATYRAEAEARVDRAIAESQRLAISGTPNFLIDGQLVAGAQKVQKFQAVIDEHLARSKDLAASGVAPAAMYGALVKHYFSEPVPETEEDEPIDPTVWSVPLHNAPVRGPKDALVTIVTFSDFQCPFCKRVEATFSELEKHYPGKLRFVWKNQPLSFHKRAIPAANAAWEVRKQKGDAAFWSFHDRLFATQSKLEDDDLEAAATAIPGVDGKKVLAAIAKEKWRSEIEDDVDEADALKVSGTPHSFVNGRSLNGAQPFAKWKKLIDEELGKAEARVKNGTPAEKVYDEIAKSGKYVGPVTLTIPADAPWRGGAKAKVVLHVFSDFQCTFCRRVARAVPAEEADESATLEKLLKKYGDKIKIVWRDFPLAFHPRAMAAANFAREANKQKGMATFWKVHDELFDLAGSLEDEKLEAIAKRHGIDWTKAKSAMLAGSHDDLIEVDRTAGTNAGVTGTPATFVNGKAIVGAQGEAAFVRAIDRALAKK